MRHRNFPLRKMEAFWVSSLIGRLWSVFIWHIAALVTLPPNAPDLHVIHQKRYSSLRAIPRNATDKFDYGSHSPAGYDAGEASSRSSTGEIKY